MLSRSFLVYVSKMKELDFKIPAKYVVIAAVLLRMKSDHIEYLKNLAQPPEEIPMDEDAGLMENQMPQTENGEINLGLASLNVPSKRQPVRKIAVSELISALRNALRTDQRREEKHARRREQIVINEENINERIALLYKRIDTLMERIKNEEIEFSKLVNVKSREEVLSTFVPLIHLDHDKKVHCRQEELFREIFIRKAGQDGAEQPKAAKPEGQAKPETAPKQAGKKPGAKLKSRGAQKVKDKAPKQDKLEDDEKVTASPSGKERAPKW
jgi:segregation and condensation protein A